MHNRVAVKKLQHDSSLKALSTEITSELQRLDDLIARFLGTSLPMFRDVATHLLGSGGKRLRPSLSFLCAQLLGEVTEDHIKGAACVELIHNATLLHDDVLDKSAVRRGKPTAHNVWTESHSILTGDFLLCKALELLTEIENWEAVRLVHRSATRVIEGQALEMSPCDLEIGDQETRYMEVIAKKTAALFEASAGLVGVLSNATPPQKKALSTFGYTLGMAFQIVDDVLDYVGDVRAIGKQPGQDFQEKKITLPVILAYQAGTQQEKDYLKTLFRKASPADFDVLLALLQKKNAFEKALEVVDQFTQQAKDALTFCDGALQERLASLLILVRQQVPL